MKLKHIIFLILTDRFVEFEDNVHLINTFKWLNHRPPDAPIDGLPLDAPIQSPLNSKSELQGYLDVNGRNSQGTEGLNVETTKEKNRQNGSGLWKIRSASGKQGGLEYGDWVYIQNQISTNDFEGFLTVQSIIHSSHLRLDSNACWGVITARPSFHNLELDKSIWKIESNDGKKGKIRNQDIIVIVNKFVLLHDPVHSDCGNLATFTYSENTVDPKDYTNGKNGYDVMTTKSYSVQDKEMTNWFWSIKLS